MIFTEHNICNNINTFILPVKLHIEKSIKFDKNLDYMSILDNFIYCKNLLTRDKTAYDDITTRINIMNPLEPLIDNNFEISKGVASHNMYFFKDKENNIKCIGGQHQGDSILSFFNTNSLYNNYHKKNIFINAREHSIQGHNIDKIYNPNIQCPYYANGLHLFEFSNNNLTCLNNDFPIITGIHPGRYDGHYGYTDNNNVSKCRNGLTVYDSLGSILYNDEKELYFLYHRANIGLGRRTIQYSTSKDLINWSEYNLVNFGKNYNYFNSNMYISNFFKFGDCYMAILPYVKRFDNHYNSIDNKQYINLYYSYDCIHYHLIGPVLINSDIVDIEQFTMATNKPYIHNNKMYFYIFDTITKCMNIYNLELNRFCYITNKTDSECTFQLKLTKFNKNKLVLNLEVNNNGYLLIQLSDKDNKIIPGYDFDSFDKISTVNSLDYVVSWKNNSILPLHELNVTFKLYNVKLYKINNE